MRTTFRRLTQSLIISILTVIVLGCSAYAANIDATVPASLPITVSSDGVVKTATNAAIHNYGSSPIFVSSINVTAENGWSLATKDAAASASIGAKVISMGFNGSWMDASGTVDTSDFDRISSSGTLNISYDAKAPGVVTAESSSTAATAIFVVELSSPATLAASSSWYKSSENRNTITKITFMDSYTPASYDEKWAADVNGTGDITCYRTGTEIIIAGNGSGKIKANADSSYLFSYSSSNSFRALSAIENLELLDMADVTNMSNMFSFCVSLTSLDVSNFDTAKVTNMRWMFYSCNGLTSLNISNFDTADVTNMSYKFSHCSALTSLDLSNFDTANVTDMSDMFYYCSGLTSLDVSNFDTANVTNMSWMFATRSGLTSLDVSNFDTANVTDMSEMFYYCSGLTSLNISNFDTANVTNMCEMFYHCSGLTTICASNKWNTDKVTSSMYMFSGCSKLEGDIAFDSNYVDKTYAKISGGYLTEAVLSMARRDSWYKCSVSRTEITKITFKDSYTPTGSESETWNADVADTGSIKCYRIGTEIIIAGNGTGRIEANADSSWMFGYKEGYEYEWDEFYNLTAIENLNILDTANVKNMSCMFCDCYALTSLDLSNFNTANVTDMYWMFSDCRALTTICASNKWNTDKVTRSESMFGGCSELKGAIAFNSNYTDKTYAKTSGGYLTYKTASTKTLSLNIDPTSGAVTSYDVSMAPISRFRAFLDWSDTANVA